MDRGKEKMCHSIQNKFEKRIQSLMKLSESKSIGEKTDSQFDLNVNKCLYCPKIFCNSQFLLKHILRRHSDNLVMLYEKLFNITKVNVDRPMTTQNDLLNFISNEFLKLRKELEMMKHPIACCREDGQNSHHCTYVNNSNDQSISQKNDVKNIDQLIKELHDLKSTVFKTEAMVQDLEIQLRDSVTSAKAYNDSDKKESDLYKNLQDNLVMEIQSIMSEIHNENESVLRKHISNFHQEIQRLEYLIKVNSDKIENSTFLQEMEKKLENEIQFFLNCNKGKKEGKTHGLSINKKNANKHKKTVTRNLSSSTSLLDCNEHKTTQYIHKASKTEHFGGNSELPCNQTFSVAASKLYRRTPVVSFTSNLPTSNHEENESCKETIRLLEDNNSVTFNSNIPQKVNKFKPGELEMPLLLDEKLKSLGIPPGSKKLSSSDFETKMKLLQADKEVLSKEYPSFIEIRQRLSSCVDDMIFLKKKGEKLKEMTFPLNLKREYPAKRQNQHSKRDSDKKVTFQTNSVSKKLAVDEHTDETFSKEFYDENVSPSNKARKQVLTENINTLTNSAASLKLIMCSNKTLRKLPNFPSEPDEELSSCSSPFDSETEFAN